MTDLFNLHSHDKPPQRMNAARPEISLGRVARAPATVADAVQVILPEYGWDVAYEVPPHHWSPKGTALPAVGVPCLIAFDEKGDAWMPEWDGAFVAPPVLPGGLYSRAVDATQRTMVNTGGVLAPLGPELAVTLTLTAGQTVDLAVYFEATADVNSNVRVMITRNDIDFLGNVANSYQNWLVTNTATFYGHGTVSRDTEPGINPSYAPITLHSIIDDPGPGTWTYRWLVGGLGNGGQIRNRKLLARVSAW